MPDDEAEMMGQTHNPNPIMRAQKKPQKYFFRSKYTYATDAGMKKNQIENRKELIKFLHEKN